MNHFKQYLNQRDLRHARLLVIWLVYIILYFGSQQLICREPWISYIPLDDKIPFLEGFVLLYILWFPCLTAVTLYTLLRDPAAFRRFMWFVAIGFIPMTIWFVLQPCGVDLRPDPLPRDNFCTWIIRIIYAVDKPINICPSFHVVGCVNIAWTLLAADSLRGKKLLKLLTVLLMVGISISTVFIKQHSALDVIVALPYALAVGVIVHKVLPLSKRPLSKR